MYWIEEERHQENEVEKLPKSDSSEGSIIQNSNSKRVFLLKFNMSNLVRLQYLPYTQHAAGQKKLCTPNCGQLFLTKNFNSNLSKSRFGMMKA